MQSRPARILLSLWLLGAAVYTANTFVRMHTAGFVEPTDGVAVAEEPNEPKPEPERAIADLPAGGATEAAPPADPLATSGTHLTEAPFDPSASALGEGSAAAEGFGSERAATAPATVEPPRDRVAVTTAVNMRTGPSSSSRSIVVQQAGTELLVEGRDGSWVQVRDPETSRTGWIFDRYLRRLPPAPDAAAGAGGDEAAPADRDRPAAALPTAARQGRLESPGDAATSADRIGREPAAQATAGVAAPLPPELRDRVAALAPRAGAGEAERAEEPSARPAGRDWDIERFWRDAIDERP